MFATTDLLEALPVAVYITDAEGRITFYNQAAAELWGHRPEIGSAQWCGSWKLYWPDGRPLPHDECPMAVTLKEGRPVRGVEAIAERPDGTRVRFLPFPTPLREAGGRVIGAINLLMDVTDRYRADLESARLAEIVASSDDAIISKTLDGRITSWNAGATRIFGYEANEMVGQPILRLIPPELHDEERDILARLQRGERIDHYDTVRVAKDGRRLDISLTVSPLRDRFGRIVGASKVARDVTERKRAEKLRHLLTDELNHRVKNTLATVQAMASQSLRRARDPADFVASFSGRLQALAKAHSLLTEANQHRAEVMQLVREQVELGGVDDERISYSGPFLILDAQLTVHLGLVLHELATNACKYGALSVPDGRLSVTWEMQTNGGRILALEWSERGGPKVSAPSGRGFGTTLIEQTMRTQGGEASINYAADGVSCRIRLPLPEQDRAIPARGTATQTRGDAADLRGQAERSASGGKRIILIEDESLVAMELESSLTDAGYEIVGEAAKVDEAKRLIDAVACDLALLDVNLAGRPVDELVAVLRRKNVPFAFVTGYGRAALPEAGREAPVVEKPFARDRLLAAVATLLAPQGKVVPLRQKRS
jgi:PAS domain S-box-containing protein